jgi:hypothetical protein
MTLTIIRETFDTGRRQSTVRCMVAGIDCVQTDRLKFTPVAIV